MYIYYIFCTHYGETVSNTSVQVRDYCAKIEYLVNVYSVPLFNSSTTMKCQSESGPSLVRVFRDGHCVKTTMYIYYILSTHLMGMVSNTCVQL